MTFIPFIVVIYRIRRKRKSKRSPFTGNLLRSPGETLRRKIEEINENINDFFYSYLIVLCFFAFAFTISTLRTILIAKGLLPTILLGILFGTGLFSSLRKMSQLFEHRLQLRLGYEAELAVGQELNQLMLYGYRVYHDFAFEQYNIDHIVVGPSGVFAVETKGKAKPDTGGGTKGVTIIYDGNMLQFPDGYKTNEPLAQAKRQAVSLSKWLSAAVGEKIAVRPALAYPGWFIKQTTPNVFLFLYGQAQHYLKALHYPEKLSATAIQRIAHQLEQKCRNVEPVAYKKAKEFPNT
jgi:hypothetical protein